MNADFFLEMLVKSGAIAGAAALGVAVLKGRPAAERANLLRAAVCALLALPVLAIVLPAAALLPARGVEVEAPVILAATVVPTASVSTSSAFDGRWIVAGAIAAYVCGVVVVLAHLGVGLAALRRWTTAGRAVTDTRWLAARNRLCADGPAPALIESAHADGPLSWGMRPGAILLPPRTIAQPEHATAVLAHEIAHFRRNDWLFLLLARVAVAVFWFNPLVWAVHWMLAHETEEAADAAALDAVRSADYAQTLVSLSRAATPIAAHGMSGSESALARRVKAVLSSPRLRRATPVATALTVLAMVAVATPLAAVELREDGSKVVRREVVRIVTPADVAPPAPSAAVGAPPPAAAPTAPVPPAPASARQSSSVTKEIRVVGGAKPKVMIVTNRDGATEVKEIELDGVINDATLAASDLSDEERERILEAMAHADERAAHNAETRVKIMRREETEIARAHALAAAHAASGLEHARSAMRMGAAHMREEAARLRDRTGEPSEHGMSESERRALQAKLEEGARKLERSAARLEREAEGLDGP